MSHKNSPTRQSFYRRALGAAGALAFIGTAAFAFGHPGNVAAKPGMGGGNGLAPDVEAMKEAFEGYLQSVEETAKLFVASDTFKLDDAHAVGAYDLISAFLHSSNRNNMSSSGTGLRRITRKHCISREVHEGPCIIRIEPTRDLKMVLRLVQSTMEQIGHGQCCVTATILVV